uniref:Uncharacterized protein n=1 Tax=Amphimedon queenslandica TaxID=400682 RepID=A0A1X7U9Y6_AMPQE
PFQPLKDVDHSLWSCDEHIKFLGAGKKVLLEYYEIDYLYSIYKALYPNMQTKKDEMSMFVKHHSRLESWGQIWGCSNSSSRSSSFIIAAWCGLNGRLVDDVVLRPGVVLTYFKHYMLDH